MNAEETTTPELKKQQILDLAAAQHEQWKHSAVTIEFSKLMDKHEKNIVDAIAAKALDKDTTAEQLRLLAAQLKTTQTIKKYIHDTQTFVIKSNS